MPRRTALLPPYATEEVAAAIVAALTSAGFAVTHLTVVGHDPSRQWTVSGVRVDGQAVVARYPFSTPDGITVPAEIAASFAAQCAER